MKTPNPPPPPTVQPNEWRYYKFIAHRRKSISLITLAMLKFLKKDIKACHQSDKQSIVNEFINIRDLSGSRSQIPKCGEKLASLRNILFTLRSTKNTQNVVIVDHLMKLLSKLIRKMT